MQVGQWDMFEIDVPNANTYENPFEDVSLNATFCAPDGRTLEFYGYYNTDSWQLRFMPDTLGTWSYEATFSDNAPGVSGAFACISSNIPGLIHLDSRSCSNRRFRWRWISQNTSRHLYNLNTMIWRKTSSSDVFMNVVDYSGTQIGMVLIGMRTQ